MTSILLFSTTRTSRSLGGVNFLENVVQGVFVLPIGIVGLELANIGNIPDVVAGAIIFGVAVVQFFACQVFADGDRLQHGAVAMPRTSHVIDFAAAGILVEVVEGIHQIVAVNIVPYLFTLIAKDGVGFASDSALHQVCQKAVQFCAGMGWTCETATPKADGFHVEIPAVFLHQHIGGNFGYAKQGMFGLVNAHRLVDADRVGMVWVNFPAGFQFLQRQDVGQIPVDFVGGSEDENRIGAILSGCFQQNQRAVGIDREIGMGFAGCPIVGGLGSGVDDQVDIRGVFPEQVLDRLPIADVQVVMAVAIAVLILEQVAIPLGGC